VDIDDRAVQQRIQKVHDDANVKWASLVSDVLGESQRRMLQRLALAKPMPAAGGSWAASNSRLGVVRNSVFEPVVNERSIRVSECLVATKPKRRSQSTAALAGANP
jgi:hypothetical protein